MSEARGISQGIELSPAAIDEQLRYWMDTATPVSARMKTLTGSTSALVSGLIKSLRPIAVQPQHGSEGFLRCDETLVTSALLNASSDVLVAGQLSLALVFSDGTSVIFSPLNLRSA